MRTCEDGCNGCDDCTDYADEDREPPEFGCCLPPGECCMPARGWQAQYQPRCDCCGRFVVPGAEGGSWVMVPATDWNAGDERERCAACTKKHGVAHCGPGYVEHLCCGMNKPSNPNISG